MNWKRLYATLAVLFVTTTQGFAEDPIVGFSTDDPAMNAAILKARETLPKFWQKFSDHAADEHDFFLKIRIVDDNGAEHFWCGEIQGSPKNATCTISNDPQTVQTVKIGQRIKIDFTTISDWMFMRGEKMVGAQTLRVIITTQAPDKEKTIPDNFPDQ
jgi:uncharacterized protein YegJ (DUF2314 family)